METTLVKVLIVKNDLEEAKSEIVKKGLILAVAHLKIALVAFSNLRGLERGVRFLYSENRELGLKYSSVQEIVEFFSYLRNKFVGHLPDELITKSLEWKPEVLTYLNADHDPNHILVYNFAILETAINTYVKPDGAHKVFNSETDLAYPPDFERFQRALLESIDASVQYLVHLEEILKSKVSLPNLEHDGFKLARKAGTTEFTFIKGKGR